MRQGKVLKYEFVDRVPAQLEDDTVYVCIPFATVVHRCCCGCGNEVVTPLSPADWTLSFDGESISLDPSIGSWSLACQSHYWIKKSRVKWAAQWSKERIRAGRVADSIAKARHYGGDEPASQEEGREDGLLQAPSSAREPLWSRVKRIWLRDRD